MIKKYYRENDQQIVHVWREASKLAHPFLSPDFLQKEAENIVQIYLPNTETWIYEKENEIVGFISMIGNEIGAIFILPQHMKAGIGTQLIQYVRPNYDVLLVKVFERNAIGRSFYAKCGFRQIGREIQKDSGEPVLVLQLDN